MKKILFRLLIFSFLSLNLAAEDLKIAVYAGTAADSGRCAEWIELLNQVEGISASPMAAKEVSVEKLKEYHVFFMTDMPRKNAAELRTIHGLLPALRSFQQDGGLLLTTNPGYLKRFVVAMMPEAKILSGSEPATEEVKKYCDEFTKK